MRGECYRLVTSIRAGSKKCAASSRLSELNKTCVGRFDDTFCCRGTDAILAPAGEFAPLIEDAERARRGRHQKSVAACHQPLDVVGVRMWMATGHIVFLAGLENFVDRFGYDGVLVISRMTQLLAQVAFADQDDADPGHLL
jgi:hypothetical protein